MSWEARKDGQVLNSLEKAKWQCLHAVFDVRFSVHLSLSEEVGDNVLVGVHEGLSVCHPQVQIQ